MVITYFTYFSVPSSGFSFLFFLLHGRKKKVSKLTNNYEVNNLRVHMLIKRFETPSFFFYVIDHFRVPKNLTFKTRLSAKPLI